MAPKVISGEVVIASNWLIKNCIPGPGRMALSIFKMLTCVRPSGPTIHIIEAEALYYFQI